ncbi:MAG: RrF2 family transcriptional regulator [Pirellulaceae bacterium]
MFSATSEYALRALVQLAREPAGVSVLGQHLAERAHIPANYLSKILWTLRNAGFLETTRGHGGGYRLAKPADQITLIEIVRHFEGVSAEPGCLLGEPHECSDQTPCSAHGAWKKVKNAYIDFICLTTLADLGKPNKPPATRAKPRKKPVKPARRR